MIISLVSNKGGTGKTTIATNLAISLSLMNKKVILVDLDGVGGVVFSFGKTYKSIKNHNVMSFLTEETELEDCIVPLNNNINLLCSNTKLQNWDSLVLKDPNLEQKLGLLFKFLKQKYDYVIIDNAPQLSSLNQFVIKNSDLIIIPFEYEQINTFATFATLSFIKEITNNNQTINKLLVPNRIKIDKTTNELKLTKAEQVLKVYWDNYLSSLEDNHLKISENAIPNSSQLKNYIINHNLPLMTTNSNAKPLIKLKEQFNNLAKEISSYKNN